MHGRGAQCYQVSHQSSSIKVDVDQICGDVCSASLVGKPRLASTSLRPTLTILVVSSIRMAHSSRKDGVCYFHLKMASDDLSNFFYVQRKQNVVGVC